MGSKLNKSSIALRKRMLSYIIKVDFQVILSDLYCLVTHQGWLLSKSGGENR